MTEKPLESSVESYFKKTIKAIGGLPLKFTSPGKRGVPDQIVLFQGSTYFVEIKRPGEKPRKSQESVHAQFKKNNIPVYTVDSIEQVDDFICTILGQKIPRKKKKSTKPITIQRNQFKLTKE